MRELENAQRDFETVRFREFTEEEKKRYLKLEEKLHANMKNMLTLQP